MDESTWFSPRVNVPLLESYGTASTLVLWRRCFIDTDARMRVVLGDIEDIEVLWKYYHHYAHVSPPVVRGGTPFPFPFSLRLRSLTFPSSSPL